MRVAGNCNKQAEKNALAMFFHRVVGFAGVYATQNYLEEKNLHNNWRISINEEGLMVFGRDVDRLKAINRRLNDS